ncbi:MAG: S1C family serine protease, partial [Planctomycetaceae bacterium]
LRRLNLRIQELKKVCQLSDSQVRRLELAAKGAVKASLRDFEDKAKKFHAQMMGDVVLVEEGMGQMALEVVEQAPGAEPSEAQEASPESQQPAKTPKVDKEITAFHAELKNMFGPMSMFSGNFLDIEQHKLWQTQLIKTLSDKQKVNLTKHDEARRSFRRQAIVLSMIAEYDERMLLTADQRQQLTALFDSELGKFLEHIDKDQRTYLLQSLPFMTSTKSAMSRLRIGAKKFLSKEQMAEMRRSPNDQWEGFGMLLNGGFEAEFLAMPVEVPEDAGFLGLRMSDDADGVVIESVEDDGPAANADLQVGDVIRKFDGEVVDNLTELLEALSETKPDQKIKLTLIRDGKRLNVDVTLGSRK